MKKLLFVAILIVGAAAGVDAAKTGDDPPPPARAAVNDTQDLLYLGAGRPAILRFHLRVNQRPVFDNWETVMKRLFAFLDRNDSGGLDRVEGGKCPSVQQVNELFQGSITTLRGRAAQPSVPFEQLDGDRDGKITFEEFCDYYRKNGASAVTVVANVTAGNQDGTADRVFALLDANKDGKLSREELSVAEKLLFPFDNDDDEVVSAVELGISLNPGNVRQPVVDGPQTPPPPPPLVLVPRDGSVKAGQMSMAREVLARLDKDKSGKLSQAESGFPKEAFAKLDRNKDGQLDVIELSRWVGGKPEAEFTIRIGSGGAAQRVAVVGRGARPAPAEPSVGLTLENVRLAIDTVNSPTTNVAALKAQVLRLFQQADRMKRGYLVKRELDPQANFYLNSIFDMADRNHDGRLTEDEVKAFTDLFNNAHGGQVVVTLTSAGQGLFQTLDANNDGALGVRELRTAWERLKEYDRDGDGHVGRNEFPQKYSLRFGTGLNVANLPPTVVVGMRAPTPGRGPAWFRKMDRNGDGDVSRKEWLGAKGEFDRVDTDGDGLISLTEAETADARWRKKE